MPYAELVFFAIQAAIQLLKAGKDIFTENVAGREISLPLPMGLDDPMVRAIDYGNSLQNSDPARYAQYQAANALTPPEQRRASLLALFTQDLLAGKANVYPATDPDELRQLAGRLAVSEWMTGHSPNPSPLQRVAGVLIEIGVEYFADVPGALNENTNTGKAVKAFLAGLEKFDFQTAGWDSLVIDLFTTALDTIKDHPELLPQDDLQHKFISTFISGLVTSMNANLAALPAAGALDAVDRMKMFSQMLLRSALLNAGDAALTTPGVVNTPNAGVTEIVQQVGQSLLSLLLSDTGPGGAYDVSAALRRTLSAQSASNLLQATLKAVSEHPDIFGTNNTVVQNWIKDVFTSLYGDIANGKLGFNSDILPDVVYMIINTSLKDLPGLLPANATAGAPGVLIDVARAVFEKIAVAGATPDQPVKWNFNLSESDVRSLFASVLSAVGDDTAWFIKRPADRPLAAALIGSAIDLLNAPALPNLKDLLNNGTFDKILNAVLSSGLADKLRTQLPALNITTQMLADAVNEVTKAITANGTAGISQLLDSGAITDLLAAFAQSQTFTRLFTAASRTAAAAAIAKAVQALRKGTILSVTDLIQLLDN